MVDNDRLLQPAASPLAIITRCSKLRLLVGSSGLGSSTYCGPAAGRAYNYFQLHIDY